MEIKIERDIPYPLRHPGRHRRVLKVLAGMSVGDSFYVGDLYAKRKLRSVLVSSSRKKGLCRDYNFSLRALLDDEGKLLIPHEYRCWRIA